MSYLVSQLKTDLTGMLHGTSLNKVQGVDELIARAGRQLMLDVDPQETIRIAQIDNALYDQVYDYAAPSDLKGDKIIDIRPQVGRQVGDDIGQQYSREFDQYKDNNKFSIKNNNGVKSVRVSKSVGEGLLLSEMNATTGWTAAGGASNLALDTVTYASGSSSLSFDVTGSTTSTLTNSTLTAVDLSEHSGKSALFSYVYLPTASQVTSVTLKWGSSDSAYYSKTVTTAHPTSTFQNGWNLLRFDWSGATETGTVDDSAIDYVQVSIVHTASGSGYRVDGIYSKMPSKYEIEYYSKYAFRTSAGTWGELVTSDTDIINLDTESYNLLLNQCALLAFQQISDSGSNADIDKFEAKYQRGVIRYKDMYKSQVSQPQARYYSMPKPITFNGGGN
jgi:hypothetical protein